MKRIGLVIGLALVGFVCAASFADAKYEPVLVDEARGRGQSLGLLYEFMSDHSKEEFCGAYREDYEVWRDKDRRVKTRKIFRANVARGKVHDFAEKLRCNQMIAANSCKVKGGVHVTDSASVTRLCLEGLEEWSANVLRISEPIKKK